MSACLWTTNQFCGFTGITFAIATPGGDTSLDLALSLAPAYQATAAPQVVKAEEACSFAPVSVPLASLNMAPSSRLIPYHTVDYITHAPLLHYYHTNVVPYKPKETVVI